MTSAYSQPTTEVDLRAGARDHLWLHFTRMHGYEAPVIVRGEGCYLFDDRGKRYLDALAGLFAVNIGYSYGDEVGQVAHEQMRELPFYTNWSYAHPRAIELATRLAELSPDGIDRAFFVSGGSEAVETAWKIARQYHAARGERRWKAIARRTAYHGTTLGALSINGIPALRTPFEPLIPDVVHVRNTNRYHRPKDETEAEFTAFLLEDLESAIQQAGPDTVAMVIMEPVQNSGGSFTPPQGYFQGVRAICDRYGILLCADEVITGFGRTGAWFASEKYDIRPDLITCAKGLSSAYAPIGAVLTGERVFEPFGSGGPIARPDSSSRRCSRTGSPSADIPSRARSRSRTSRSWSATGSSRASPSTRTRSGRSSRRCSSSTSSETWPLLVYFVDYVLLGDLLDDDVREQALECGEPQEHGDVVLGDLAADLDVDAPGRPPASAVEDPAELLDEGEARAYVLGDGAACDVNSVGDELAGQGQPYGPGDREPACSWASSVRRAEVGGRDDVLEGEERQSGRAPWRTRRGRRRRARPWVRAANRAASSTMPPRAALMMPDRRLHLASAASSPIRPRVSGRLRQVHGDEVGPEQLVERYQSRCSAGRRGRLDVGVVGDHVHAERGEALRDEDADATEADHAERLLEELRAGVLQALPGASLEDRPCLAGTCSAEASSSSATASSAAETMLDGGALTTMTPAWWRP